MDPIVEGDIARFTLMADPPPKAPLPVSVTVSGGTNFLHNDEPESRTVIIGLDGMGKFSARTDDDEIREGFGWIIGTIEDGEGYVVSQPERWDRVIVNDNDAPNPTYLVWISETELTVDEAPPPDGTNEGTYQVQLQGAQFSREKPINITIRLVNDDNIVTVSPEVLTFSSSETDSFALFEPQTVTVTAVNDEIDNPGGMREATIEHHLNAAGTAWDGLTVQKVTVTVADDDGHGVNVDNNTLDIIEGVEGTYSVSLRSGPDEGGEVTVTPRSTNQDITFTPGSLTFNSSNWADPQSIAFEVAEQNQATSLTVEHSVEGYGDERDVNVAEGGTVTVTVNAAQQQSQNEFTYRLCAWDHQSPDGDRVDVYVNGQPVFSNVELSASEECRGITLRSNPSRNTIQVRAINVGEPALVGNPPRPNVNTAALRIRHATSGSLAPLAGAEWELSTGQQQGWSVYALSETQVTLSPVAASQAQKNAIQGTVAGVAAATVSNVTSNIGARFSAPSGGVSVSLAGTPLVFGGPKHWKQGEGISSARGFDALGEEGWRHRTMTADDLLRSSSFEIALGASESDKEGSSGLANAITIWGRGDLQFFESGGGTNDGYDGDLVAGYLGADIAMGDGWLVGVAVSRIAADADYTLGGSTDDGGALEVELTNIHPYIRAALNDSSEAWAILGAGTGELTDTGKGSAQTEASKSDMTMRMLSAGMRHRLDTDMGFDLAVLGDGSFATVETEDGTADVDGITADVWRARLGVEASHTSVSESGSSFTTFLEVAARQDGGDGATGTGLELSPGVAFSDPASGFSLEARGRALAVHSADNHREYGASLTASVTPGANGRGLSLAISPVWGTPEDALGEADRSLFFGDAGERRVDNALSLNSRLSYGFSAGRGVVAPFAALSLHNGDRRRLRIGSRYSFGSAMDLELSGSASSSGGSAQSVQVSGRIRF